MGRRNILEILLVATLGAFVQNVAFAHFDADKVFSKCQKNESWADSYFQATQGPSSANAQTPTSPSSTGTCVTNPTGTGAEQMKDSFSRVIGAVDTPTRKLGEFAESVFSLALQQTVQSYVQHEYLFGGGGGSKAEEKLISMCQVDGKACPPAVNDSIRALATKTREALAARGEKPMSTEEISRDLGGRIQQLNDKLKDKRFFAVPKPGSDGGPSIFVAKPGSLLNKMGMFQPNYEPAIGEAQARVNPRKLPGWAVEENERSNKAYTEYQQLYGSLSQSAAGRLLLTDAFKDSSGGMRQAQDLKERTERDGTVYRFEPHVAPADPSQIKKAIAQSANDIEQHFQDLFQQKTAMDVSISFAATFGPGRYSKESSDQIYSTLLPLAKENPIAFGAALASDNSSAPLACRTVFKINKEAKDEAKNNKRIRTGLMIGALALTATGIGAGAGAALAVGGSAAGAALLGTVATASVYGGMALGFASAANKFREGAALASKAAKAQESAQSGTADPKLVIDGEKNAREAKSDFVAGGVEFAVTTVGGVTVLKSVGKLAAAGKAAAAEDEALAKALENATVKSTAKTPAYQETIAQVQNGEKIASPLRRSGNSVYEVLDTPGGQQVRIRTFASEEEAEAHLNMQWRVRSSRAVPIKAQADPIYPDGPQGAKDAYYTHNTSYSKTPDAGFHYTPVKASETTFPNYEGLGLVKGSEEEIAAQAAAMAKSQGLESSYLAKGLSSRAFAFHKPMPPEIKGLAVDNPVRQRWVEDNAIEVAKARVAREGGEAAFNQDLAMRGFVEKVAENTKLDGKRFIRVARDHSSHEDLIGGFTRQEYGKGESLRKIGKAIEENDTAFLRSKGIKPEDIPMIKRKIGAVERMYQLSRPEAERALSGIGSQSRPMTRSLQNRYQPYSTALDYNYGTNVRYNPETGEVLIIDW